MSLVLGLDGGGTRTRAVCVDAHGKVLGSGLAGPSNHRLVGFDAAARAVVDAAREAVERAGVTLPVNSACCALAGVGRDAEHQQVLHRLRAAGLAERLALTVDAEAALAGAVPDGPTVVVIAGTGAVAWGRDAAGKRARADGWGPLLGDDGSATWIGREALRAAIRALDGRAPETCLGADLTGALGVTSLRDLLSVPPEAVSSRLAELSVVCDRAAARGDAVALSILDDAAEHLARSALAVCTALQITSDCTLSWAGGVFASPLIRSGFGAHVARLAPGAILCPPVAEPVMGAALLALAALNDPADA